MSIARGLGILLALIGGILFLLQPEADFGFRFVLSIVVFFAGVILLIIGFISPRPAPGEKITLRSLIGRN